MEGDRRLDGDGIAKKKRVRDSKPPGPDGRSSSIRPIVSLEDRATADETRGRGDPSSCNVEVLILWAWTLILGALILIGAVRGWFRGFLPQAVGLASLAGCVYLADPVRDLRGLDARQYLPTIQHELLDRLLGGSRRSPRIWSWPAWQPGVVRALRRRTPFGEIQPNYSDQGAGFVLGGGKALIIAAFIASGIVRDVPEYIKAGRVGEQVRTSRALEWTAEYKPVDRIWSSASRPVVRRPRRCRGFGADPVAAVREAP